MGPRDADHFVESEYTLHAICRPGHQRGFTWEIVHANLTHAAVAAVLHAPDWVAEFARIQRVGLLNVQVFDVERVFLDEFAAGLDVVAHQDAEHLVGRGAVLHRDLQ